MGFVKKTHTHRQDKHTQTIRILDCSELVPISFSDLPSFYSIYLSILNIHIFVNLIIIEQQQQFIETTHTNALTITNLRAWSRLVLETRDRTYFAFFLSTNLSQSKTIYIRS